MKNFRGVLFLVLVFSLVGILHINSNGTISFGATQTFATGDGGGDGGGGDGGGDGGGGWTSDGGGCQYGCVPHQCTNGATNYPYCNNNHCTNGTSNFPYCNQCPYGKVFQNGHCVSYQPPQQCGNGCTNYPNCNTCPSGQQMVNGHCQPIQTGCTTCNNGGNNWGNNWGWNNNYNNNHNNNRNNNWYQPYQNMYNMYYPWLQNTWNQYGFGNNHNNYNNNTWGWGGNISYGSANSYATAGPNGATAYSNAQYGQYNNSYNNYTFPGTYQWRW
jgi:hypothetical protein